MHLKKGEAKRLQGDLLRRSADEKPENKIYLAGADDTPRKGRPCRPGSVDVVEVCGGKVAISRKAVRR
eukprot:3245546-Prorocentrum_lima.AAC.1